MKVASSIAVFVPDAEYDVGDEESYASRSLDFKKILESEYCSKFEEENIGPGADIPAYMTLLPLGVFPYVALALALFFSGKKVEENIDAWVSIGARLSQFFYRRAHFNREGAAVIAVTSVVAELAQPPHQVQLLGYAALYDFDGADPIKFEAPSHLSGDVAAITLSRVTHAFQISTNGREFIALVEGSKVTVKETRTPGG